MIPERTLESIQRYVNYKVSPGHFVRAVLENDLFEAFGRGDEENLDALKEIVIYVYSYIPSACWGSPGKVKEWLEVKDRDSEKGCNY